nr:MAG TPA: hypothetical protein [Caudoviricetes sp.]
MVFLATIPLCLPVCLPVRGAWFMIRGAAYDHPARRNHATRRRGGLVHHCCA